MALEPGGYADKLGNRYEGRWTVRQMLRVLSEELRSVVLESVGDSQRGIDLRIRQRDEIDVAQQCKIRNKSRDKWTIADLDRAGVLAAMKSFLSENPKGEFSFVSAVQSTGLHDLCESARASNGNADDFYKHQVQELGSPRRKLFSEFCNRLGLSNAVPANVEVAFDYLRRMSIESYSDDRCCREDLLRDAANLVVGPPEATVAVLADFAQGQLRQTLDAPLIWKHLASQDLQPRRLESDPRVLPAIRDLQRRFADSIRNDLIAGELIHRAETDRLVAMLREHPVVVLHGAPGQGKSGVLFELVKRLESDGTLYLPIRLDRNEPKHTTRKFGGDLGLSESPVHCLKSIAGGRSAIVILDQLDAIRWTSRHSLNALEVCKSLVGEVKSLSALGIPISAVIACRTYDLKNDPQIRAWLGSKVAEDEPAVEVQVSPLSIDVVAEVAKRVGGSDLRLSQRQSGILQSPQHLAMWA